MNEHLEKAIGNAKVLAAMVDVLNTATEGKSDISTDVLAWYTNAMLTLASDTIDNLEQARG